MTWTSARLLAATAIAAALFTGGCSTVSDMWSSPTPHAQVARDLGMPTANPEALGFSSTGIEALTAEFHALVDQQKLAGVTTLVARHGKVVQFDTYGKANAVTGDALKPDSIFRIASMTKPITGVAMMQLWEQGKWSLSDPVSKYIPEFASLKVKGPNGTLVEQNKPMTMAQLMSHSAGFGVSAVYDGASLSATNLQGMIDKLKMLPLETQPGSAWDYGPSVNIQGYIVEKLSG
jgi:CubicO group peptidase (beta-lactamase class C family)